MPQRRLSTNWITAYSQAMQVTTEAPDQYVIWSAISVVGAVLKKRVWLKRGPYKVYPNQYIVLVGPPGVGKGTAVHPAHAFIKDYKTPQLSNYLNDRVTAPEIIRILGDGFPVLTSIGGHPVATKESTAVIFAMELATFLGASDWMTSFLCQTWDQGEFEYGTKHKGSNKITGMCISLIGACTPDFIRKINGKQNASDAINGGFTARTLFVFANEKSKDLPWPIALEDLQRVPINNNKSGKDTVDDLRHDLEQIAQVKGEFTFAADARQHWDDWYKTIKALDHDSDVIRYFKSRQNVHVLKVAMCLSAAASDSLVVDMWSLKAAIALVDGVLNTLDVTFRGVGESSLAEATAKIQSYMERKGLTSRSELIRDNHRSATVEDLDRIINTLNAIGCIKIFSQGGRQFYEHVRTTAGTSRSTINNP